jgi:hypothetical protein
MTTEQSLPSPVDHVIVDTIRLLWNVDNGGASMRALRDIAKSHVKTESIILVTT